MVLSDTLTLKRCIEMGIERNLGLQEKQQDIRIADISYENNYLSRGLSSDLYELQMGMIMQGKSYEEAAQMATISSKGSISCKLCSQL